MTEAGQAFIFGFWFPGFSIADEGNQPFPENEK